jgi:hypothetical protein
LFQPILQKQLTVPGFIAIIELARECGCSSVVERNLAKVDVVGSNPITRFGKKAMKN